jgi:hypothetical protein
METKHTEIKKDKEIGKSHGKNGLRKQTVKEIFISPISATFI